MNMSISQKFATGHTPTQHPNLNLHLQWVGDDSESEACKLRNEFNLRGGFGFFFFLPLLGGMIQFHYCNILQLEILLMAQKSCTTWDV